MPNSTFYNLSDDKKQRIFDSAVKEFSAHRFSEASINQIIKHAGIPKGSFYQYFNDKEDIYLYMMDVITNEKQAITRNAKGVDPDADLLEMCIQKMKASYEWGMMKPEYSQIGILMLRDTSEFMVRFRATTIEWARKYVERDKARGIIKPDVDSNLIADIIITLILNEGFLMGLNEEMFFKKLSDVVKILREGIAVPKG